MASQGFKLPNREPLVGKDGRLTPAWERYFASLHMKTQDTLDLQGQITPDTPVAGRTEGIGETVQNIQTDGKFNSTDNIIDGTGNPLAGGTKADIALDSNARLANSFRANAVNVANVPTSASVLSNDGASTAIAVAANSNQFGTGLVSYNSGTVDPGAFGTFRVYADDPTFSGGAVIYHFTTNAVDLVGTDGRINFGKITTVGGTPNTGGGNTGGTTPGGEGGRGVNLG